jgi:hypothetical protein
VMAPELMFIVSASVLVLSMAFSAAVISCEL